MLKCRQTGPFLGQAAVDTPVNAYAGILCLTCRDGGLCDNALSVNLQDAGRKASEEPDLEEGIS